MRLSKLQLGCIAVAGVFAVASRPATAAYILTPTQTITGASSASVAKGSLVSIDFVLTSTGSDVNNSAIFQVNLSAPSLVEQSYVWATPYTTGTTNDDSTPNSAAKGGGRAQTPTAVTATTFNGPVANAVDLEFNNFLDTGTFGTGKLVTMVLQVPAAYSGTTPITVTAIPDTFANGFTAINTTAGPAFTINVVPEPGTIGLLGVVAGGLLARRRTRPAV